MRILVLTMLVAYPADAGPKIKTLQVLRHLAAQHQVVYCTFTRSAGEIRDAETLGEICCRVATVPFKRSKLGDLLSLVKSLAAGDSFLLRRNNRSAMRAMVRKLLEEEQIDVVHVDQLNMMPFVPPEWSGTIILDEHNAVWQMIARLRRGTRNPLMRWLLGRETRLLRTYEGKACRRAQVVLAVSEQDRQALREVAGETVPIEVVPITIDTQSSNAIWAARHPQPGRLLTIGTMSWLPNSEGVSWWLQEGYEKLKARCPDLVYDIVGANPPGTLRALARGYKDVYLHGYVADVTPFWTGATALLVPILSGGGVRVKILEAMAMGVPVVSTTIGCEGLEVRSGEHLLVADTPVAFVEACVTLLREKELAHRLASNARQLVLERYDARVALKSLDDAYMRCDAKGRVTRTS